jgi:Bacteriocin-protection, YdeI or OmpD-Associated
MGIAIGDEVSVELAPEGPQRGDLADDIAAAPAAGAFFDTLAQFYRKAYLRWIDSTTRRPDLRAARIAEVVGLLAAGSKNGHAREAGCPVRSWVTAPMGRPLPAAMSIALPR